MYIYIYTCIHSPHTLTHNSHHRKLECMLENAEGCIRHQKPHIDRLAETSSFPHIHVYIHIYMYTFTTYSDAQFTQQEARMHARKRRRMHTAPNSSNRHAQSGVISRGRMGRHMHRASTRAGKKLPSIEHIICTPTRLRG